MIPGVSKDLQKCSDLVRAVAEQLLANLTKSAHILKEQEIQKLDD